MAKKIESLTPEQEALLPVYADKWISIGLSTEPVDFEKAKEAVCVAYDCAGLDRTTNFHVVDGPLAAIELIQKLDPKKTPRDIFQEMSYGAHDASWLSYYEYLRDVLDIEACKKLNGLIELARHSGWFNAYEDTVVFQHRPEHIKFDEDNRLHSETGPAILYRDGFAVYAWHGVRVPADWIEKKAELTPQIALTWENIEQRRAACEIIGWARILRELDARVIDSDDDPMIGNLLEVDLPEIGTEKFLQVLCGTGRTFAIPVPPHIQTALEGNAWSYGIEPDVLRDLEVRT